VLTRLRDERGMGLIELVAAMVVITIALLALMASYDQAFFSLHSAARKTAAASLAEAQLELYSSLSYTSIGLSSSLLTTANSDTHYSADKTALADGGTDVTNTTTCTTSLTQCKPLQTSVLGSDGLHYRIETFIREVSQSLTCQGQTTSCGTAYEHDVTVIVRDPNISGTPQVYEVTAAFDAGPR
jgi:type II secretory pathway pseudopilin PulG